MMSLCETRALVACAFHARTVEHDVHREYILAADAIINSEAFDDVGTDDEALDAAASVFKQETGCTWSAHKIRTCFLQTCWLN